MVTPTGRRTRLISATRSIMASCGSVSKSCRQKLAVSWRSLTFLLLLIGFGKLLFNTPSIPHASTRDEGVTQESDCFGSPVLLTSTRLFAFAVGLCGVGTGGIPRSTEKSKTHSVYHNRKGFSIMNVWRNRHEDDFALLSFPQKLLRLC